MKYFVIFLVLVGSFSMFISSSALVLVSDPKDEADVIIVGTIISSTPHVNNVETEYHINIEEIMKGQELLDDGNQTESLTFFASGYEGMYDNPPEDIVHDKLFNIGDRTLLLLKVKDDAFYEFSGLSIITNADCTGEQILARHYVPGAGLHLSQGNNTSESYYTNMPITAKYYYFNKDLMQDSVDITVRIVDDFPDVLKSETFHFDLEECQTYALGEMNFTITKPSSFAISVEESKVGNIMGISGIDVIDYVKAPLQQFQSGISFKEIQCKENLKLIQKYDGTPACVTEQTKTKLIERGWITAKGESGTRSLSSFSFEVNTDTTRHGSQYQISGGKVDTITYDKQTNSLMILLSESEEGYLRIVIPSGLLHTYNQDAPFVYSVMVDNERVKFEKFTPILLRIPFEQGTKAIEITGISTIN